jgi:hypothetical protein
MLRATEDAETKERSERALFGRPRLSQLDTMLRCVFPPQRPVVHSLPASDCWKTRR